MTNDAEISSARVIRGLRDARQLLSDPALRMVPIATGSVGDMPGAAGDAVRQGLALFELWNRSHARLRRVANEALRPASIAVLEAQLRDRARVLLAEAGASDNFKAFAAELAGDCFLLAAGVPEADRPLVRQCAAPFRGFLHGGHGRLDQAAMAQLTVSRLFGRLLDAPLPPGAFLLEAASTAVSAGALTRDEATVLLPGLLFAGGKTLQEATALLLERLAAHDAVRAALRDGTLSEHQVVMESLRLMPHRSRAREAIAPVTLADAPVPAGARVVVDMAVHSDPELHDDPDRFDPWRPRRGHVIFGAGENICPGRHISMLLMCVAAGAFAEVS